MGAITSAERFAQFVATKREYILSDLVGAGNASAISYADSSSAERVLGYAADGSRQPKGYIALAEDGGYELTLQNMHYTGKSRAKLRGMELELFDWMVSEMLIEVSDDVDAFVRTERARLQDGFSGIPDDLDFKA